MTNVLTCCAVYVFDIVSQCLSKLSHIVLSFLANIVHILFIVFQQHTREVRGKVRKSEKKAWGRRSCTLTRRQETRLERETPGFRHCISFALSHSVYLWLSLSFFSSPALSFSLPSVEFLTAVFVILVFPFAFVCSSFLSNFDCFVAFARKKRYQQVGAKGARKKWQVQVTRHWRYILCKWSFTN